MPPRRRALLTRSPICRSGSSSFTASAASAASFGFRYDFNGGGLTEAEPMPRFLLPVRERAAAFAGFAPERLQHILITEYRPGAAIGWHRDRANFGDVIGVSLLSPCTFRMRRRHGAGWERAATPRATSGNTASPPSMSFATRSRSARCALRSRGRCGRLG
jgi:hypothetical protein